MKSRTFLTRAAGALAAVSVFSGCESDKPVVTPTSRRDGSYDWQGRHQAALKAKITNPQIVFIGDSITHHLGGIPAPTGPFISHRGDQFWKTICTKDRPGLNLGFGADWTVHALWRLDHGELDGISPEHVVLMIGTNDVLSGSKAENTIAGVRECLIRIREKTPRAQIILMGVLPCLNPASHPKRLLAAKVNAGLNKLAEEMTVQFLDLSPKYLDVAGNIPVTLMHDGVHPTPTGYKIWCDALIPFLKKK
jgi:lysophospholipase L1-like esterase